MIWRKFTVTSRNLLRDPIARLLFQAQLHLLHPWSRALRGARNPHVPACTLRSLRRTWMCKCRVRSEEHTSELQSLMRISYAVFCLKKKTKIGISSSEYTCPIDTK